MRVFVTGGTGFVGAAVINHLLANKDEVVALVRSEKSAEELKARGVKVLKGTIDDVDVLREGASQVDAVMHLAFIHNFADLEGCCATDRAAITAMGDALVKSSTAGSSPKALVVTSGTMMLKQGVLVDEDSPLDDGSYFAKARGPSEKVALDYAKKGVRASVVRFPPTTYGPGMSGFTGYYIQSAIQKGVAVYVGDGENHWAAGHRDDAAAIFRLAAEKAEPGSIFHASTQEGVTLKDIANTVGKALGVPTKSIEAAQAEEYFGHFSFIITADSIASNKKTQQRLAWKPSSPALLDDMPSIVEAVKALPAH